MLHRTLARGAAAFLGGAGLLALAAIANDRGILDRDLLSIGRQWIETRTPARAAQGSACMPTTGTVSGLTFAQDTNAALAALLSSNSGASAPANDCSAAAVRGQVWLDTSTGLLKQFDGTSWLVIGYADNTNHIWTPPVGGGIAALASAGTTDLGSVPQSYVVVSGSTTITNFGSSAVTGTVHWIKFSGTLTITYNASSMILPGAVDLPIAPGDQVAMIALGGGNWQALHVTPAAGRQPPITCVILSSGATTTCSDGNAYAVNGVFAPKAGATRLDIRMVGGGGGGGGNGTGTSAGNGVSGGTSNFNGVIAGNGGNGGANSSGNGGSAGAAATGSGTATARMQGMNGAVGLGQGSPAAILSSTPSGGTGLCAGSVGNTVTNNCGAGGVGANSSTANIGTGGSGAGGETVDMTIANPSGSYTYAVGAGGAGGTAGTGGVGGSAGIAGRITVKMFFD
jgi:hypothetical protein